MASTTRIPEDGCAGYGTVEPKGGLDKFDQIRSLTCACVVICVLQGACAFAQETFNGTQVFFLGNLQMDPGLNDGMTFARDRFFMVLLLVCGKLGENGLGRFEVTCLGGSILIVGVVMVSLGTHPWLSRLLWYTAGAFVALPFSEAALAANLPVFLADQFNCYFRHQHNLQEQFFWWLNVAINVGFGCSFALLAFYEIDKPATAYLTTDDFVLPDTGATGPARYYWSALIISSAVFVASFIVFTIWSGSYTRKSRDTFVGSSVVGLMQMLVKSSRDCSVQGVLLLAAKVTGMTIYVSQALLFWSPALASPLSLCSAIGVLFTLWGIIVFCRNLDWLDQIEPPEECTLPRQDVKDFLRLLPLLVCSQMAYGTLFSTMRTWFARQTCQMDMRYWWFGEELDANSPQIFSSFLMLWMCIVIAVGTPVALYVVNPRLEHWFQSMGMQFHDWTKYLIGLMFGVASVLCAAHFEVGRRAAPRLDVTSNCAPYGVGIRDISVYWMILPYILMGISTMYAVPSIMLISYRQAPRTMRTLTIITNIFMMSASNSVVMALSLFMREYTPHDLDSGNLEYLYFIVIFLSLVLLALFASLLPYFEEKVYDDLQVGIEDQPGHSAPLADPAA